MFDPNYDPMASLEQLQADVAQLKLNVVELARAFNHQVQFTQQLTLELSNHNAWIEAQKRHIKDLEKRLQEIEHNGW